MRLGVSRAGMIIDNNRHTTWTDPLLCKRPIREIELLGIPKRALDSISPFDSYNYRSCNFTMKFELHALCGSSCAKKDGVFTARLRLRAVQCRSAGIGGPSLQPLRMPADQEPREDQRGERRQTPTGQATQRPPARRSCIVAASGSPQPVNPRFAQEPREIIKAGAKFKSLNETWADTTTPMGNLVTTSIAGFAPVQPGNDPEAL